MSGAYWMGPLTKSKGWAWAAQPVAAGCDLGVEVGADVEVACAGAAEEPLDGAAGGEVEVEGGDVERDDAGGLVEVGDDVGADGVGALGDGGEVLQGGAAEGDVGDADELGALVDGVEDALRGGLVRPSGSDATETISAPWRARPW